MNISIAAGTGTALTALGAFDVALHAAGVSNYNLIRLSSVIPPASTITSNTEPLTGLPGQWGDKLYVVYAEQRAETPGEQAWAGIGWVQDAATGKGLFVEHEGTSEQKVRDDITNSLKQLMVTRGVDFGEIQMNVTGITCQDKPVCALVIAVYEAAGWIS